MCEAAKVSTTPRRRIHFDSLRHITTAEAIERIFAARHPKMAAEASEEDAEQRDLREHFHKNFPGVDDPSMQFKWEDIALLWHVAEDKQADLRSKIMSEAILRVESISARDAELAVAKWESARDADLAAAKQRYADTVSARRSGTFSEEDLTRLYYLRRMRRIQDGLREGAAMKLCSALEAGDLAVFLSGDTRPRPKSRWSRSDALGVLKDGLQADGRAVVIKEADFVAWLHSGQEATGAAESVTDQTDAGAAQKKERDAGRQHGVEVKRWHDDWSKENPLASDTDAWKAAKAKFPDKGIPRRSIINMRKNSDGTPRTRGRKSGKQESTFR